MSRPLRVCFVAYRGNMNCGGQGIYLWFLARELSRLGIEVDVVVGPPYPDPMPFARLVERLPNLQLWGRWFTRDWAGMLTSQPPLTVLSPLHFYELMASRNGFLPEPFAFSARAFRTLARRLRQGDRFDLIHDVQCLGWGLLALQRMGLPVVSTIHHPLTVDRRASFLRDRSVREMIGTMKFYPIGMQANVARRLDRIFTSSEESARTIVNDFGVAPDRIRNVLNGIDIDLYCPDPAVPRNEGEILCVGRASDPNKGIRVLIRALALLPKARRLVLIDDAHPGNNVFGWARECGVLDRLHVTGRVSSEELVRHYRSASVVVVPSRYEGFGLPAVEAMACGTPVVATRAGALPEVLGLTGGGILVDMESPEALARGVEALLGDPARRHDLGTRGRARVVEHLSWQRVAVATAAGYDEVLRERRGRPTRTITSESAGH